MGSKKYGYIVSKFADLVKTYNDLNDMYSAFLANTNMAKSLLSRNLFDMSVKQKSVNIVIDSKSMLGEAFDRFLTDVDILRDDVSEYTPCKDESRSMLEDIIRQLDEYKISADDIDEAANAKTIEILNTWIKIKSAALAKGKKI